MRQNQKDVRATAAARQESAETVSQGVEDSGILGSTARGVLFGGAHSRPIAYFTFHLLTWPVIRM